MTFPYTITAFDEARNRALLVQARVERQMRPQEAPPAANHPPLMSIIVARTWLDLQAKLAAYRRNHPGSPSEPASGALCALTPRDI